jgi:xanthine dehydrogenase accessory factor
MLFGDHLVVVRGGGDLATGVIYRLREAGFPVVVLELERPLAIRRAVAAAGAVIEGRVRIEDLDVIRVDGVDEALEVALAGDIPVMVSPVLVPLPVGPSVVVDARIAKRNIDTTIGDAPFVIGLGPGFDAAVDCDAVIETMRGHHLGRVIRNGGALPDTGVPGSIGGKTSDRVVRAPASGVLDWRVEIGNLVTVGDLLGDVAGAQIRSSISGVVRGLLEPGREVEQGLKIGDVDPRADVSACFEISDKALSVGGGVVAAILGWLNARADSAPPS